MAMDQGSHGQAGGGDVAPALAAQKAIEHKQRQQHDAERSAENAQDKQAALPYLAYQGARRKREGQQQQEERVVPLRVGQHHMDF
jgi:hypothetical protein